MQISKLKLKYRLNDYLGGEKVSGKNLKNRVLQEAELGHLSRLSTVIEGHFKLSKPTVHVMHHQFNIQQLYALPTLYLCVLYLSENKQRLVPLTA